MSAQLSSSSQLIFVCPDKKIMNENNLDGGAEGFSGIGLFARGSKWKQMPPRCPVTTLSVTWSWGAAIAELSMELGANTERSSEG